MTIQIADEMTAPRPGDAAPNAPVWISADEYASHRRDPAWRVQFSDCPTHTATTQSADAAARCIDPPRVPAHETA